LQIVIIILYQALAVAVQKLIKLPTIIINKLNIEGENMEIIELIEMKYVVGSLLYTGIGIAVFAICFFLFDALTPKVSIWKELIEKQNIALGIFLCGIFLGIAIIIGSAIHS